MGKGVLARPWVQQLAVALGYALAYTITAQLFADAPWPVTAALRIACLLLVPYRYWPALALGEVAPLIYLNVAHLNELGLRYTLLASFPPVLLGMPVVKWFRCRAGLFPAPHLVDVKKLLGCVLTLTVLWAYVNYALLFTMRLPTGPYQVPPGMLFLYLIHFYMAMLTIAPWVMIIRIHHLGQAWRLSLLRMLISPPMARDLMMAVLALAGLAYLHQAVNGAIKPATVMALFLPAIWLALKHGWRAAVLGGTLSLIVTCLLLDWQMDPGILQAQIFMAFVMTCLYTFGAQTSSQWHLYEQALQDTREARKVAQSTFVFGELRLRHTSQALECVASILRLDHEHLLKYYVPEQERREYSQQAQELQRSVHRMAENIHPSAWRERGLGAAFHETIGQTLREAGIDYDCEIPWRQLRFLPPALQAALYRTTCEAVALASTSPACCGIYLGMRIGRHRGHCWVVLRIKSERDNARVAEAVLHAEERQRVAPKLGATISTMDELQTWMRVFDGKLRVRNSPDRMRVSALLCDASTQTQEQRIPIKPVHLWVG